MIGGAREQLITGGEGGGAAASRSLSHGIPPHQASPVTSPHPHVTSTTGHLPPPDTSGKGTPHPPKSQPFAASRPIYSTSVYLIPPPSDIHLLTSLYLVPFPSGTSIHLVPPSG